MKKYIPVIVIGIGIYVVWKIYFSGNVLPIAPKAGELTYTDQ